MDNFQISIVAEGVDSLRAALSIALRHNAPGGKISHWAVAKDPAPEANAWTQDAIGKTLILLWHEERESQPFPAELDLELATSFVDAWLKQQDYGQSPDHDGSNGQGWRVFCDHWGHVLDHHYAICGIQPQWAMYGK